MRTAADIMTRAPYTFAPDTPAVDAVGLLIREHHSGAPVVQDGELVGVISELDMLRFMSATSFDNYPAGSVGDHMSTRVLTVPPDLALDDLAQRFLTVGVRRFPVVKNGELLGLVAVADVLTALAEHRRKVATRA